MTKKKLNPRQQLFVDYYCSGMSASKAYEKAGYKAKNPNRESYILRQNPIVAELIEQRKAEISKNVDDILSLAEQEAIDGILQIGRSGENDFAKLKAWQDILDRRRGKARQAVDVGGQEGNPIQSEIYIMAENGEKEKLKP